jgi:CheY-like chemotaxis protein
MKTILQVEERMGVTNPIQIVTDGRQAIEYLQGAGKYADRATFPLPCLILMDLKLPYVMGLDVLKWIRQQPGPTITVIMLTASGEDADIAAAYRLGANAFLTKPSQASKFQEMVKAIKDFWLTHNTLPNDAFKHPAPAQGSPAHASSRPSLPGVNEVRRQECCAQI